MKEIFLALAGFAAWWVPVVYIAAAGYITHRVAGDNARARDWMIGLFVAVFLLLVFLLFGLPGSTLDD